MKKRIHFIGGGQMSEAIIRAILANRTVSIGDITVTDVIAERNAYLTEKYGVTTSDSQAPLLSHADIIVIAVRPQDDLATISNAIRSYSKAETTVVSIVAGVSLEKFESLLGKDRSIVRVIPNTLTDTGLGYSGVALNAQAKKEQVDFLLHGFGKVMYVVESLIDSFTGFGVAGPNYVYYFIESLADAGVLAGLSRHQAWNIALENVTGAVEMLKTSGKHPRQLLDINNSAGGVGIHALYELNNSDFAAGLQRSVLAAIDRTTALGKE
ncbi:pyrroline-5-carboxylate reductase [Paraliobacillus ryukyuensis]|uniref:Pyrroline-5-carboxylate reductase n=1 Tax=Paraliobacillus ryukyuensis TaxID=200904 RepID=A0A366EGW9_9BACI|nr:pyrroline-5-carboxylate reductase [Paraliobacillus ryukyuensis]RBP00685.1 pyrroline-5-carboxylate reductase [Paraliobacillus ryukyuensis]